MTGMVRHDCITLFPFLRVFAARFPLRGGKFDPSAGHHVRMHGYSQHTTIVSLDGCDAPPGFLRNNDQLDMKYKAPRPEDYSSDEEYLEAMDAYEAALYWKEEQAMEDYYEKKQ